MRRFRPFSDLCDAMAAASRGVFFLRRSEITKLIADGVARRRGRR